MTPTQITALCERMCELVVNDALDRNNGKPIVGLIRDECAKFMDDGFRRVTKEEVDFMISNCPPQAFPIETGVPSPALTEFEIKLVDGLKDAERFLDYFANNRNFFVGGGTPMGCLSQINYLIAEADKRRGK